MMATPWANWLRQQQRANALWLLPPQRLLQGHQVPPVAASWLQQRRQIGQQLQAQLQQASQQPRLRHAELLTPLLQGLAQAQQQGWQQQQWCQQFNIRPETLRHYLQVLQQGGLLTCLPAWQGTRAERSGQRLLRKEQWLLADSGHLAYLTHAAPQMPASAWRPLLYSHLVATIQQQAVQQQWPLQLSHYGDKDQQRVELVLQADGQIWGLALLASVQRERTKTLVPAYDQLSVAQRALKRLSQRAGHDWQGGIIVAVSD